MEPVDYLRRCAGDFATAGAIDLVHGEEDTGETGHGAAVFGREVGAAVEGFGLGGEEDGHGPASLAGDGLDGLHVDGVDVGPFLPIDFDVDEAVVHEAGDGRVFEGLPLHDVAPVAGGIADAEEDGFIFRLGLFEGFRPPGIPVDWVVGVLEEVGAGLVSESVGHGASGGIFSYCAPRGRVVASG